jgi:hypothetical protein
MSRTEAVKALADELRPLWIERARPRLERVRDVLASPRQAFGDSTGLEALADRGRLEGVEGAEFVLRVGLEALAAWLVALFPHDEIRARVLTLAGEIVDGWRWEKVLAELHGWTWAGANVPVGTPIHAATCYALLPAPWPEGFKVEDAPALIDWIRSTLPSGKFARRRAENLLDVVRGMDFPNLELRVPSIGLDDRGRVFDTKTKGLVWAPLSGLAWIWAAYHSTKPEPIYDRTTGLFITDTGEPTVTTISAITGANLDALRAGRDGSAKAFRNLKAGSPSTKPEGVRFVLKCGDQQLQLPYVRENEEPINDASAIFRALHVQPWMGDDGLRDLLAVYCFAHLGAVPGGGAPTFVWYEDEHVDLLGIPSAKVAEVRERFERLHRTNLIPVGRSAAEAPVVASLRIWRGRGRPQARLLSLAPALYTRTRDADGRTHRNAFPMRASVLRDPTPYVAPAAYHSTALISSVWPARPRVERTEDGRPRVRINARNLGHRLGLDVRQRRNLPTIGTALDRLGEHGFADWSWDGDLTWASTLEVAPHPDALDPDNPRKLRPFEAPEVPRDSKALRDWIKAQGRTVAGLARELGLERANLHRAIGREEEDGGTRPLPLEVRQALRELLEQGR